MQESIKVVAKGSGMPQFFNDESIIKAMIDLGIEEKDARNYAIVGCVELTTHGNNLGWSDAAMFNLNKALELTLNEGKCLLTGEQSGLNLDARNYAIVGCVELTTHGNNLGWSDAAMFNLNKALELTLNEGKCLLTGEQSGLNLGKLEDYKTFEDLEEAFKKQIDYFIDEMMKAEVVVEKAHQDCLPSAFLSTVIDDCLEKGLDVL